MTKHASSVDAKVADRIQSHGEGWVFTPQDFCDLGTRTAVATALKRAKAIGSIRLQPTGVYAANLLGLSEQVPAKVVFLTDGASRSVLVGPTQISLKRTTPRNMAAAGRLSALVIQAFRSLGAAHITPARIARLRESIPAQERASLLQDVALAPEWKTRSGSPERAQGLETADEIEAFFRSFHVDVSAYKFDRIDANAR